MYFVFAGKKIIDGFASDNCSVGARNILPSALKAEVEKLYKVQKLLEERQGFSFFTAYSVDLIGLPGKYAISIQEDVDENRATDLAIVSVFQF